MAIIGAFAKQQDGSFRGYVKTLTLTLEGLIMRPSDRETDKAPDYRIFAARIEVGAAWKKVSRDNRDYLSVKLDDPSFPSAIYASLVDADEGYSLVWSRHRAGE